MDKQTLKQYLAIVKEIGHLKEEKESVFLIQLQRKPLDGMPRSTATAGDPVGQAVEKRAKLDALIDAKLDNLIALREEIERAIEALPPVERDLLRLRYITGLTWPDVTERLYGDEVDFLDRFDSYLRRVTRQHERAIRKIESL